MGCMCCRSQQGGTTWPASPWQQQAGTEGRDFRSTGTGCRLQADAPPALRPGYCTCPAVDISALLEHGARSSSNGLWAPMASCILYLYPIMGYGHLGMGIAETRDLAIAGVAICTTYYVLHSTWRARNMCNIRPAGETTRLVHHSCC
jgi:hypothetical protein